MHAFWLVLTYDLLEDRRIDDIIIKTFFNSLLYKTNRFQVSVHLFSKRSQRMSKCQNVVRTSVTHSAAPRVPLFCSHHILTSSVIYYWTDTPQLGISLPNRPIETWNLFVLKNKNAVYFVNGAVIYASVL